MHYTAEVSLCCDVMVKEAVITGLVKNGSGVNRSRLKLSLDERSISRRGQALLSRQKARAYNSIQAYGPKSCWGKRTCDATAVPIVVVN